MVTLGARSRATVVYGGGCERVAKLERRTRSGSGSSQPNPGRQGGASSQVARCRPKSSSTQTRPYARRPAPSVLHLTALPGSGSRPVNTPQCPLSWPNILAPAPGPSLLSSSDSLLLLSIHFCSLSSLRLSQKSTTVSGQKYLSLSPRFVHSSSLIVSQRTPRPKSSTTTRSPLKTPSTRPPSAPTPTTPHRPRLSAGRCPRSISFPNPAPALFRPLPPTRTSIQTRPTRYLDPFAWPVEIHHSPHRSPSHPNIHRPVLLTVPVILTTPFNS